MQTINPLMSASSDCASFPPTFPYRRRSPYILALFRWRRGGDGDRLFPRLDYFGFLFSSPRCCPLSFHALCDKLSLNFNSIECLRCHRDGTFSLFFSPSSQFPKVPSAAWKLDFSGARKFFDAHYCSRVIDMIWCFGIRVRVIRVKVGVKCIFFAMYVQSSDLVEYNIIVGPEQYHENNIARWKV